MCSSCTVLACSRSAISPAIRNRSIARLASPCSWPDIAAQRFIAACLMVFGMLVLIGDQTLLVNRRVLFPLWNLHRLVLLEMIFLLPFLVFCLTLFLQLESFQYLVYHKQAG